MGSMSWLVLGCMNAFCAGLNLMFWPSIPNAIVGILNLVSVVACIYFYYKEEDGYL